jgi:hypothetical protein
MPECSCATGSSGSGADAEHDGSHKRYKGQDRSGPRHCRRGTPGNDGRYGGLDGIHKPEPTADEIAGENEAEDAGGEGDKGLQHIEFLERGSNAPLQYGTL